MAVKAISELHAFSGCDTVCFLWKSKNKASENSTEESQIHDDVFWSWSDH